MSEQDYWVEEGEAVETKLIVFGPPSPDPSHLDELEAALDTGAVAAFVMDPAAAAQAAALQELCRRHATAFLVLDDAGLARRLAAEGVHLQDPEAVEAAREKLGARALLGASCGHSRHLAMVAGEAGADYVMFGALPGSATPDQRGAHEPAGVDLLAETAAWWNELFVLPAAVAAPPSDENAEALVRAGAAFLAVDGGPGVAATSRLLAEAIGRAGAGTRG